MEDYPELSENAKKEALKLIDKFKADINKAAEDVLSTMYCYILPFMESDSWTNFQTGILSGLKNYGLAKTTFRYDFEEIRKIMFHDYRDEIIQDIQTDILAENERLKECIKSLEEEIRNYRL